MAYGAFTWFCILTLTTEVLEKCFLLVQGSHCSSSSSFSAWECLRSWDVAPSLTQYLCLAFYLKWSCADVHICTIIRSLFLLFLLSFPPSSPSLHIHAHAYAHRGKSICVRHSARERQRHWVNYPSFTAAEKSRWQQTICKWQGAVNYSIFLD